MAGAWTLADSTERNGTPNVTGVLTGTAVAGRISLIKFVTVGGAVTACTFNGVSNGLVNGTDCVVSDLGGGSYDWLMWVLNPTGTSGTLSLTGPTNCAVQGCASITGCALPVFHSNLAAADNATINTPLNGVLAAAIVNGGPASAVTWTNATEDLDYTNATGNRTSLAHTAPTSAATGTTITASSAASVTIIELVSFSPSGGFFSRYYYDMSRAA